MSSGVGIDVVEIGRVEAALERRPRLAERIFTEAELAYARSRARPARHLAARFAAKEAVLKALGGPAVPLREIEVLSGGEGPTVRLSGRAAEIASAVPRISLTHERELAAAVAVI